MTKTNQAEKLIGLGAEIAGNVAAAAAATLAGGPSGAIAASALSPLITHNLRGVGAEIKARLMGPREEVRAGAALAFATVKIEENLAKGRRVRNDDYFTQDSRSTADEIAERALLAAQREPEEKKIQFFGNLVGNLPFQPEIDRATANLLVRLGESLSYQQLILISVFLHKDQFGLSNRSAAALQPSSNCLSVLQETLELYHRGLLGSASAVLDLGGLVPNELSVQGLGMHLYRLMELHQLDRMDVASVGVLLRDPAADHIG